MVVNHHFSYDCGGGCMLIVTNSSSTEDLARNVTESMLTLHSVS